MKKIKAVLSVILALSVILTSASMIVSRAKDTSVTFAVVSDIHSEGIGDDIPVNFPENELYFHARNSGNLYNEAIGILKSFLARAQSKKLDFVLIPGDLTNCGREDQVRIMTSVLAEFEKNSGIQVYVTPGNHDYWESDPEGFKKDYRQFGFGEALSTDTKTASYTVDLPGNCRLFSIDSQTTGQDGDALDERLFSWIDEQAKQAEKDGKTVIAMMHCPLLDPIPLASLLMKDFIVRDHEEVAERFTKWNIQYVFTGHEHGNNITSYTGKNGNVVYDILTTALTSYPLEYRYITLSGSGMDIKCELIDKCNFGYIGKGYNAKQIALMKSDYTEYSYGYFKYSIQKKIGRYITPEFINGKLKQTKGPVFDAVNTVMPLVEEALQMPLYKKDTDGLSVEELANASSATLPESGYTSLYDLATTVVAAVYYGAENMPPESSPEARILIVGLNTMLKYILAEAGNRTAALALNSALSLVNLDAVDKVDLYRWNRALMLGADKSYDMAEAVLSPLLNDFLVDDEICDRDCTLPGPGEKVTVNRAESFSDWLKSFFLYIENLFRAFFR